MTNDEVLNTLNVKNAMDADTHALGGKSVDIWVKAHTDLYNSTQNIIDSDPTLYSLSMDLSETNYLSAYKKWPSEMERRGLV